MKNEFKVTFLGVGGSLGFYNGQRGKYGCNTLSIAVNAGGREFIFDAGSGIINLKKYGYDNNEISLFLTHYHIDHIGALLFWDDIFNPNKTIDIYGFNHDGNSVEQVLDGFLCDPYHPAGLKTATAKLKFYDIEDCVICGDVKIDVIRMCHPTLSLGYALSYGGKKFCYMTDVELALYSDTDELEEFARDCDLLVIDSFFEDGKNIRTWGHSNWRESAEFAKRVNAKQAALFHYDYKMTDGDIAEMEKKAQSVYANVFASAEGSTYNIL